MDTDQARPPPLPSKLRWRPYANGTSKKNATKPKKDDSLARASNVSKAPSQGPNPKAAAHKIRGEPYYAGKAANAPVGIKLQWEEAETVESMSHGGHPHNQHVLHSDSDRSRDSSPSASSVTSSSSTAGRVYPDASPNNNINGMQTSANSSNLFANAMQRAMASLPSPPVATSPLLTTRLDLVGGQSDFGQYRASIPDLTTNGYLSQNNVQMNAMASDTAYQIALTALLQSQNVKTSLTSSNLFNTPAVFGGNSSSNVNSTNGNASLTPSNYNSNDSNSNAARPPTSAAALLGSSNINSMLLSDLNRVISNQELLGLASLDELLTSCGYSDSTNDNVLRNPVAVQMLASPAITDQSFNSSPMNGLLDFSNTDNSSRATSPASGSFSPMAVTSAAFEALLVQPIVIPQQQASQPRPIDNSNSADSYSTLMQELTSPFRYLSTSGDSSVSSAAPAAWPSLFPGAVEDSQNVTMISVTPLVTAQPQQQTPPQRMEIATQTDGPYEPPLTPMSAKNSPSGSGSLNSSPLSAVDLTDDELDPDWLSFLDEASPLFNDVEMPSPPTAGDEADANTNAKTNIGTANATQRDKTLWNWAEQLLKPGAMTPTANRTGFPGSSVPTMTSGVPAGGTIGNGGLVRTLQGNNQQKSSSGKASSAAGKGMVGDPTEGQGGSNSSKKGGDAESTKEEGMEGSDKSKVAPGLSSESAEDNKNKPPVESTLVKNKEEDVNLAEKRHQGLGGLVSILKALWIGKDGEK